MAINLNRLKKVLALADSPQPGERDAAITKASEILAAAGKCWLDIPDLFAVPVAPTMSESSMAASAGASAGCWPPPTYEDVMEAKEPGWKARAAEEERAHEAAEEVWYATLRVAVIEKYGSAAAALAPSPMEAVIDAAVAPFVREEVRNYTDGSGHYKQTTLDGWTIMDRTAPDHVVAAVRAALPLPATITAARTEVDVWNERDHELGAMHGDTDDTWLSPGCYLRSEIVRAMLHHEVRATCLADAIVRQRVIWDSESVPTSEESDAMLADLEYLAAVQAEAAPVQIEQLATTTARRQAVLRMLADADTADLPLREIARRCGVSASTVLNLKRSGHAAPVA